MTNTNASIQIASALKPIAARIVERQELIESRKRSIQAGIADALELVIEQGQDLIAARAKLHGNAKVSFAEWLKHSCPTVSASDSTRYIKVASQSLSDVRRAACLFLPQPENSTTTVGGLKASPWEKVWAQTLKLRHTYSKWNCANWPRPKLDILGEQLEPVARALWPEKF